MAHTTPIPPDLNAATQEILRFLTTPPYEINDTISPQDLISGYTKWREKTSTSPSGRHLGHYKSMLYNPKAASDPDAIPFTQTFFTVQSLIMNSCLRSGYILDRWKAVINSMIEKIPGTPRIDKLRVIHLFESDINLVFGILWNRRLLHRCEHEQILGDEQWGSRPGKAAADVAAMKLLTYEISHLTRTDHGTFDHDAKSCYDRIIPNLAMMTSRHYGMTRAGIRLMGQFLLHARYQLATSLEHSA